LTEAGDNLIVICRHLFFILEKKSILLQPLLRIGASCGILLSMVVNHPVLAEPPFLKTPPVFRER
jgi:hypothetical protein